MPRLARIVMRDVPHHVTQRGNRREEVFFEDADRRRYLLLMLQQGHDEQVLSRLRMRTRTGRPAGNAAFVARLETLSGRWLAPRHGGRPRKTPRP